jgi:hypothetical protein
MGTITDWEVITSSVVQYGAQSVPIANFNVHDV